MIRRAKNRVLVEIIYLAMALLDKGTYVLNDGYKLEVT